MQGVLGSDELHQKLDSAEDFDKVSDAQNQMYQQE